MPSAGDKESNLVYYSVSLNELDGSIPTSVTRLKNRILLTWNIPSEFGLLHKMKDLRIGFNELILGSCLYRSFYLP